MYLVDIKNSFTHIRLLCFISTHLIKFTYILIVTQSITLSFSLKLFSYLYGFIFHCFCIFESFPKVLPLTAGDHVFRIFHEEIYKFGFYYWLIQASSILKLNTFSRLNTVSKTLCGIVNSLTFLNTQWWHNKHIVVFSDKITFLR